MPGRKIVSERVRHKKRQSTYSVLGEAEVQSSTPIFEGDSVVVYRADTDGSLWVRPPVEFNDGRFEQIEPLQPNWLSPDTIPKDGSEIRIQLEFPRGVLAYWDKELGRFVLSTPLNIESVSAPKGWAPK
jgi:hypothetical protein